jgi:transposase
MGIRTSRHTILRRIMALPAKPIGPVIQLGIDDFSFKRGRTFGTLLVNMQTHQVVDVLADRKAETSATWMASHPEIEAGRVAIAEETMPLLPLLVPPRRWSRADRFHMIKNLGEALEGCLARHLAAKRQKQTQKTLEEHLPIGEAPRSIRRSRDQSSVFNRHSERNVWPVMSRWWRMPQTWDEPGRYCRASGHWSQHRKPLACCWHVS